MTPEFVYSQLTFSVELLKKAYVDKKNILISPISVALALGMASNGADGKTEEEFARLFSGREDLKRSLKKYRKELVSYVRALPTRESCSFSFANSVWFPETLKVKKRFIVDNSLGMDAEVRQLEFNAEAAEKINAWVCEHTGGKIESIIDSVAPEAMMYLINALTLDAEWARIYQAAEVSDTEFTNADGSVKTVSGMCCEEDRYIETEDLVGFLKPYAGYDYGFLALLPKNGDLDAAIAELNVDKLFRAAVSESEGPCDAMIPKFSMEYNTLLNGTLSAMGIPSAFNHEADFSGISRTPLNIGEVIHSTCLNVDERGTSAGAVTAIMMKMMSMPMPKPQVYLDRPFLFAIVDMKTMLPMFIGGVNEL